MPHKTLAARREWARRHRAAHVEEFRVKERAGYAAHRAQRLATQRKWYYANHDRLRAQDRARDVRRSRHGPEYAIQLATQGGGCAVCGRPPTVKRLHWDHDHATGTKRGILCTQCNIALGMSGDSAERLRQLADYLNHWIEAQP